MDIEIIWLKGLFKERNDGVYIFRLSKTPELLNQSPSDLQTMYSQIIEDEHFQIRMAIFQAVLECQGDE